jgi:putative transposon-encoded protein
MKFEIEGKEIVKKVAKPHGDSAHVYLPKSWVGQKVAAVQVEGFDKVTEHRVKINATTAALTALVACSLLISATALLNVQRPMTMTQPQIPEPEGPSGPLASGGGAVPQTPSPTVDRNGAGVLQTLASICACC